MNSHRSLRYTLFVLFAAAVVLLTACQPAAPAASPQATLAPSQPPAQPSAIPAVPATQAPAGPTQPSTGALDGITLDYSAVAQDVTVETVPAKSASANGPIWDVAPEYRRLTLQGYPVANHLHKPQIFVYPAGDLASANESMGKIAADLQALLQSQKAGDNLPFLPLFNAAQVMHAQVQYLEFKNGKGVRYLTQFDQAPLPISNYDLFYTFQGLTSDGKFYIAAILPVTNPELPAGSTVSDQQATEMSDFPGYLSKMVSLLEQQPASSFTPDLDKLDALIKSMEVK
ncbi:MAG: hypothetical protein ACM3PY_08765 [Omnitrophica WOR_2 bacterium]